jgi:hypothetical protein
MKTCQMKCQLNRVNIPPAALPPSPLSRQPLGAAKARRFA